MSEKLKQSIGNNEDGWKEVEAMPRIMPKHMREDTLVKPENDNYQPKHMKKAEDYSSVGNEDGNKPKFSEKDQARLEAWQATIQELRNKRNEEGQKTVENEQIMTQEPRESEDSKGEEDWSIQAREERRKKAVRPEDYGMTAEEFLRGEKIADGRRVGGQTGMMIVQGIRDGDSRFWVGGTDRDDEPFETTLNQELEKYREQIIKAKNIKDLSRATRIFDNAYNALGGSEEVWEQFKKVAEESGYRAKQEQFSGDPAKFEKESVDIAVTDLRKQIEKVEKELSDIKQSIQNYRGIGSFFGKKRAEKEQLKWQYNQTERRLTRMNEDLRTLEERASSIGRTQRDMDVEGATQGGVDWRVIRGGGNNGKNNNEQEIEKAA